MGVYNDTKEKIKINAFSYSDGIRLAATTTHILSPGQTKEFKAGADDRGLIIATGKFNKGQHFHAKNGEFVNLSAILEAPKNGWAVPLTIVSVTGVVGSLTKDDGLIGEIGAAAG